MFPFCVKRYGIFKLSKCNFKGSNNGGFKSILLKVSEKKEVGKILLRDFPKKILSGKKYPYLSNTSCKSTKGFISSSAFSVACLNSSEGLMSSLFNEIICFSNFAKK